MNSKLFIADKIKVGFNLRSDTYTGKLGYVIGHDGKKWRKEPSWEGWRLIYMDSEQYEIGKRADYNQRVKQYTNYHEDYVKRYGNSKNDHNASYYERVAKMTLQEYLDKELKPYDKFTPHLGNVSNDKGIIPVEYENVPTEGFVLNKKAGGYSSGWNHRSTYCRVYDPRGFEFEITIPNLLYILQECTSTKGKGLDGSFVYSWDGKDLVLLPTVSEDYVSSAKFTALQSGKVAVKDLIVGCTYKTKQMDDYIYLGKFNWFDEHSDYTCCKKQHVFYKINSTSEHTKFLGVQNLTSFVKVVTDTPVSNYAELLGEYNDSKYSGVIGEVKIENAEISKSTNYYYSKAIQNLGECLLPLPEKNKFEIYSVEAIVDYDKRVHNSYGYYFKSYNITTKRTLELKNDGDFEIKTIKPKKIEALNYNGLNLIGLKLLTTVKNINNKSKNKNTKTTLTF